MNYQHALEAAIAQNKVLDNYRIYTLSDSILAKPYRTLSKALECLQLGHTMYAGGVHVPRTPDLLENGLEYFLIMEKMTGKLLNDVDVLTMPHALTLMQEELLKVLDCGIIPGDINYHNAFYRPQRVGLIDFNEYKFGTPDEIAAEKAWYGSADFVTESLENIEEWEDLFWDDPTKT